LPWWFIVYLVIAPLPLLVAVVRIGFLQGFTGQAQRLDDRPLMQAFLYGFAWPATAVALVITVVGALLGLMAGALLRIGRRPGAAR
jgi:hypothetical protein